MGGLGSGTWVRSTAKPIVENGLILDLSRLIRMKDVIPGKAVSGSLNWTNVYNGERVASIGYEVNLMRPDQAWMRLHYRRNGKPEDYTVRLTTTRPNFGGLRWWFVCPITGIRTAKLYFADGGNWFASRQAYRLGYRSQCESSADRQASRAHSLRRKLGGQAGFDQPFSEKPKGMHWKTYNRICNEIQHLEHMSMACFDLDLLN
jgi:hypothetical protein